MRNRRSKWAAAAVAALAGAALTGCSGSSSSPQSTLTAFDSAWDAGDYAAMADLVADPAPTFSTAAEAVTSDLGATRQAHTFGVVTARGSTATAPVTSTYQLPVVGAWTVTSTAQLTKRSGHWLVDWSPSIVAPQLAAGDRLSLSYEWPPRAAILGSGGAPLTTQQPQVVVGVEGSRVKNAAVVTRTVEAAGATAAEVTSALAVARAHPTWFAPVFTITQARFDQLGGQQSALYQVPGTVFQHTSARTAITPGLAADLVGSLGPITAQQLAALGPAYDAASVVGQTGIENAYQAQLAGTPGGQVAVVHGDGSTGATVATWPAKPGTPVETSIVPADQVAAETALTTVRYPSALVAINAATGQVLAAASSPVGASFDSALEGQYAPGSTFKLVTSTALIEKGLTPGSPASCPPTVTVDGEIFHNAEGEAPVSTMGAAFTESCNTAFIQLATTHLSAASFPATAAQLGIGADVKIGLAAVSGSVPQPTDEADLAATAIGQARVVVSPLAMATVAAAIDTGVVRLPRLVAGAPDDAAPTRALPSAVVGDLQQMMAAVVASGTAAGTGLPPGTHAKTGTAQFGSGTALRTNAWLAGYDGNVAFAMVVQGGTGNGGPTDGPVVARVLRSIATGAA